MGETSLPILEVIGPLLREGAPPPAVNRIAVRSTLSMRTLALTRSLALLSLLALSIVWRS